MHVGLFHATQQASEIFGFPLLISKILGETVS